MWQDRNVNREEFDSELEELFRKAEALIPEELLPDLPFMKEVPDVHDWYMFEHELWAVGEEIRQLTLKYKKNFVQNTSWTVCRIDEAIFKS